MTPWKLAALVLFLLLPGGSLALLAMAALKALHFGKIRLSKASPSRAPPAPATADA
jgi:hypothetical protein